MTSFFVCLLLLLLYGAYGTDSVVHEEAESNDVQCSEPAPREHSFMTTWTEHSDEFLKSTNRLTVNIHTHVRKIDGRCMARGPRRVPRLRNGQHANITRVT